MRINLTDRERVLMAAAADGAKNIYSEGYGLPTLSDRKAGKLIEKINAAEGQADFEEKELRNVCLGLEYLFWARRKAPEGITALLAKLEALCGYKRLGMLMQSLTGGI